MNPVILYKNILDLGTPTATDTASGYDVLNLRDGRTFTIWEAASFGTKYITIDAGAAVDVDALGVIGHNLKTANASVSVESSATGAWAGEQTERLAPFTPDTDLAFLKPFTLASARYCRVKILTAAIAPRMAVCVLGERLTFEYPPDAPTIPFSESIEGESVRSKGGHLLGATIKYFPIKIEGQFSNFSRTWAHGDFLTFWRDHGRHLKPFFYAYDLDTFPAWIHFCQLDPDSTFETPLSVLSIVDSLRVSMRAVSEV